MVTGSLLFLSVLFPFLELRETTTLLDEKEKTLMN